jgi:hypothetical protein
MILSRHGTEKWHPSFSHNCLEDGEIIYLIIYIKTKHEDAGSGIKIRMTTKYKLFSCLGGFWLQETQKRYIHKPN